MQYIYAIIDSDNICVGISYLCGQVSQGNMIQIDETTAKTVLGCKYQDGTWIAQAAPVYHEVHQEIIAKSAVLTDGSIILTLPEGYVVDTGTVVKFEAPCECTLVTAGLIIGEDTYVICDAMDNVVSGVNGAWSAGSVVAVVIGVDTGRAYILNAAAVNLESNRVTGTLPISKGGTGGTTPAAARSNLGLGMMSINDSVSLGGSYITGTLPISKGGTGGTTASEALSGLGVSDHIIDAGATAMTGITWAWRKYASGIAECWGVYTASGVNVSEKNYHGFYYSDSISVNYPFAFIEKPALVTDGGSSNAMNFARSFGNTNATADRAKFIIMCLADTQTSVDIKVSLHAIGRWKAA